jgi:hypothetical protein
VSTVLQLDDWVLCRIYNKKGVIERYDTVNDDDGDGAVAEDVKPVPAPAASKNPRASARVGAAAAAPMKVELPEYGGGYYDYDYDDLETPSAGMLCFDRPSAPAPADRDSNNSVPWTTHQTHTDNSSSGSERVLSPSPDLPDRDHAESQPAAAAAAGWWPVGGDWGSAAEDGFMVDVDGDVDDGRSLFGPLSPGLFARVDAAAFGFGDMLASYLHKPF